MIDQNAERDPSPLVFGAHHCAIGPSAFLHPKRVTHSLVDDPYGGGRKPVDGLYGRDRLNHPWVKVTAVAE
jgi:hypothetical protein